MFSPHTSLDATPNGINAFLARPFESLADKSKVIEVCEAPPSGFEEAGMGRVLTLKQGMKVGKAVEMVKSHLGLGHG